ncbi:copper chaperone PCu(A)C [Corynebacterium sputi]|uniref:copper chaperone PCu(A)C n=1 Tax=Corynebacterium sputi TaxID=489915 RepID=UPI000409A1CC|nr:copper chaperone PCu(A)C [Corynebacterium sputi]
MTINRRASFLVAIGAATSLVITGCGTDEVSLTNGNNAENTVQEDSADEATANSVAFVDGYIREKAADNDMTAVFGSIVNNTDDDLVLESFEIEGLAEGTVFELHEVADGVMRPVDGGFDVPADSEAELEPGSLHLMVMNNDEALEPGEEFTLVLRFDDGSELTVTVPVRVQPSGEEDYGDIHELGEDHGENGDEADGETS